MPKLNKLLVTSIIADIRECVHVSNEIYSWLGDIEHLSWKFPMKAAKGINAMEIVKEHDGTAGEFYILLLELAYDRLFGTFSFFLSFFDFFLFSLSSVHRLFPSSFSPRSCRVLYLHEFANDAKRNNADERPAGKIFRGFSPSCARNARRTYAMKGERTPEVFIAVCTRFTRFN
ncbi:hypothetical protein WN51_00053 [Melipona quadrifasciata]|uniref:Uncharacterized protein n=1 Tax=Melipona quadrifasciata TaxID=166423 RepID=A0A0N0U2I3_9HYME|nr:hypothetical protein WN51_00053 [Melipona quadrifasciata]